MVEVAPKLNSESAIKRAENAVKAAEKNPKPVYVRNAERTVGNLIDSPEKDGFIERLEALETE